MQYCSLQHRTLLLSPATSTTGYCFCFGSIPSFFLELFLHWSPVAYWAPNDLGSSSLGILSFCLFLLFMGFSRQEYWSGLPFPSPVDHILTTSWYVRSMNQGKLEVVRQDMARVNMDILGISELKWTGMGEFNSDDHYIYYCGQESLRINVVAIMVNKRVWNAVLRCDSQKWQNDLCSFPR